MTHVCETLSCWQSKQPWSVMERKKLWLLHGSSFLLVLSGSKISFLVISESLLLHVLSCPAFSWSPGCKPCSSLVQAATTGRNTEIWDPAGAQHWIHKVHGWHWKCCTACPDLELWALFFTPSELSALCTWHWWMLPCYTNRWRCPTSGALLVLEAPRALYLHT